MPYRWEPDAGASGRYRNTATGRFVPGRVVRAELDTYLSNSDTAAKALAEALRVKSISLADWELGMRRHVKNVTLNAVAMERGGYANMRPSDYGRAGQIVREQYGYLKGFAGDIASGKQRLDGTLTTRAHLYTEAGRNAWYKSHEANLRQGAKVTHQRSIRGKRDSCWQCIELHGKVFAIGDPSFPLPGRRVCNHNCGCHLEYLSIGSDGEYQSVEVA
jgi:hypothetical protein